MCSISSSRLLIVSIGANNKITMLLIINNNSRQNTLNDTYFTVKSTSIIDSWLIHSTIYSSFVRPFVWIYINFCWNLKFTHYQRSSKADCEYPLDLCAFQWHFYKNSIFLPTYAEQYPLQINYLLLKIPTNRYTFQQFPLHFASPSHALSCLFYL